MKMGKRIESAMLAADLNQTALAGLMGVTPQAVQQWISGETSPKGKRLELLAEVLRVSAYWLLTGNEPKHENLGTIQGQMDGVSGTIDGASEYRSKPPVIDEEAWKNLPPKTKALVEDLLIKTTSGKLKESGTKLLQNTLDELSKDP